ncbi:hypothetical protein CANINC_003101 [Pichia inconspicua]|uniref:DNA-binding protein RAP1 n=1 Tax=Pichia inconspicua TaxID=52247 RepID=A0A4T0WZK3_9ASCO|nr:hypothetical protein CANINC_003101 [[Candida] inconspicua]
MTTGLKTAKEDSTIKHDETNTVNEAIVAAAVAAASVLNSQQSINDKTENLQLQGGKVETIERKTPRRGSETDHSLASHFQNQIQSQLQDQIQDELRLEDDASENNMNNSNINILDSTNIDDELRNLEQLVTKNDSRTVMGGTMVEYSSEKSPDAQISTTYDNDTSNVAAAVINSLENMTANELNTSSLSKKLSGKSFFLPIESEENENIQSLIRTCGGNLASELSQDVYILVPSKEKVISANEPQYLYQLVYDVYMKKSVPNFEKYKVNLDKVDLKDSNNLDINVGAFPIHNDDVNDTDTSINEASKGALRKSSTPTPKRRSKKFTKEEDDFILDLVRRNPHLRSTHTFFARISQLAPLSEHTGNSIRYRYRKILAPTLSYVYKIDPATGKPEIDPDTNEPLKVEEIPSLIKAQYIAEEDYLLCRHILSFKSGEMVLLGKKKQELSQIPEAVFQELNKLNPRHSAYSWRDRYRKFAAKFGLRRYVSYYEDCIRKNVTPEPMKNMSSRADRKDYKVDVFENDRRKETAVTDSQKRAGEQIDAEMKKIKIAKSTPTIIEPVVSMASDQKTSDDIYVDPALEKESTAVGTLTNASVEQTNIMEPKRAKNAKISAKGVSKGGFTNSGANLFAEATEDEIKQYDIALDDTEIDCLNGTKKKISVGDVNESDVVTDSHVANNDVELINVKADDGLMDFRQLLDIDPEPLKHRDEIDLEVMTSNIQDCFRKFGDGNTPYELFKDISDQTGISMLWLNYWFDCSCGMLGTFIQAIIHYLRTGELVMNNVSGFWTEKDDELLKLDPNNERLLELHGKDSVTKRKAVLLNCV